MQVDAFATLQHIMPWLDSSQEPPAFDLIGLINCATALTDENDGPSTCNW